MGMKKYPLFHVSTNQISTFHYWKQITFKEKPVLPLIRNFQIKKRRAERGKKELRKLISTVECLIRKDRISTIPRFHKSNLKLPPLEANNF